MYKTNDLLGSIITNFLLEYVVFILKYVIFCLALRMSVSSAPEGGAQPPPPAADSSGEGALF